MRRLLVILLLKRRWIWNIKQADVVLPGVDCFVE